MAPCTIHKFVYYWSNETIDKEYKRRRYRLTRTNENSGDQLLLFSRLELLFSVSPFHSQSLPVDFLINQIC